MKTVGLTDVFFAALLIGFLAGCSNAGGESTASRTQPAREFSEQDKIAARALSIANSQAGEGVDSPYARALLCRNGLITLAKQFDNFEGLGAQQEQAFRAADAYYDRQLQTLGSSQGKSKSDIAKDLQQVAADNPDLSSNARVVMACLQRLREKLKAGLPT